MSNVIVRGFANVARFSGRDARGQFWPYCGAAFGLYLVVGWAVSIPIMSPIFSAAPPSGAAVQTMVSHFLLATVLAFCLFVTLIAAGVARRLHDTGRSALWGLLPLPFVVYSLVMFPGLISQVSAGPQAATGLFFSVFASNLLYMAAVVTLIVLLTRPSASAPNRYG